MKSIVTKLVIYKKDPRFDYCPTPYYCEGYFVGGGQFCSYCGITDTQAQEKEIENTFIGDDAMREYWAIRFNNLQEQDRKLILSAFPDIESKDKNDTQRPARTLRNSVSQSVTPFCGCLPAVRWLRQLFNRGCLYKG